MATITVTTAADVVASDGVRSLREAVAQANATTGADLIVFSSSLEGRTLTLTQGELAITHDLTIDGDQNNDGKEVTLSGGDRSRILHVSGNGTDVQLRDLTLTQGRTTGDGERGGAILADGGASLHLDRVTVRDSHTTGLFDAPGGGISGESVILIHSTITGNSTAGESSDGGGVYGSFVSLTESVVSGNRAAGYNSSGAASPAIR
jgi:trimeric autotransporter adhesin